jgi:hypothetical protein
LAEILKLTKYNTMSKLKDKIGGIIFLVISVYFCQQCTRDYAKGGDNKAISNYEKMIFEKSIVQAELYPTYQEVTVKVLKTRTKSYTFRYHFEQNGTKYEGKHTFMRELPKSNTIQVYYLTEDPNFNCADPTKLLEIEKNKNSSKSDLYWGIGWGILGLLTLLGMFAKDDEKPQTV